VACPVTIDIHISYFSPGDSRRRAFLPDTGEADIINSLQIGRTRRSLAGYFKPDLVHELRRRTGVVVVEGLVRPLPGHEDAAPGDAEVLGSVRLALAHPRRGRVPHLPGLDAVEQPDRAVRRARRAFQLGE